MHEKCYINPYPDPAYRVSANKRRIATYHNKRAALRAQARLGTRGFEGSEVGDVTGYLKVSFN